MKDWRRGPDWGEELPQQKGGVDAGWGQPHPAGSARSSNCKAGKPPPAPGSWQPTVPSWEKRFCTSVCRVPWGKICEAKRLMSFYSSVLDWDDSAGKEAFDNAKARFFAEINGLPCDISLPGPDIYIDEVNWDTEIDPQLLLDLDKEFIPADMEAKDGKVGFLSSGWDRAIPCTGWGDAEDVTSLVRDAQAESGWVNSGENVGDVKGWDDGNGWGDSAVVDSGCLPSEVDSSGWGAGAWNNNSGWGDGGWDDNTGWGDGTWEDNTGWAHGALEDNSGWRGAGAWGENFHWGPRVCEKPLVNKRHSDSWRQQDNNRNHQMGYWNSKGCTRKREGEGLYGSRSPAFRQQRDDFHQPNNNQWRNNGRVRKKANHQNLQSTVNEPLVPRQWNAMRSCGPRNNYGSAAAG